MQFRRLLLLFLLILPLTKAAAETVLVLPFENTTKNANLTWIGESIAETAMSELSLAGQLVCNRATRREGFRRLGLRTDAALSKGTVLKVGQVLDADYVLYGSYNLELKQPGARLQDGILQISAHIVNLRKFTEGPNISEAGKLTDLSKLEDHLAWQSISFLQPGSAPSFQDLTARNSIQVEAKESYIRGLLAQGSEKKMQWLLQAAKLDPSFVKPYFDLGNLALGKRDYQRAADWFRRIPNADPHYFEARFKLGLSSFYLKDFNTAERCFFEISQKIPLNEVFNNLGATQSKLNQTAAAENIRRAIEGDGTDPVYHFNFGVVLWRQGQYEQAANHFRMALERSPEDQEAKRMLELSIQKQSASTFSTSITQTGPERLKSNFDESAYRQLKAALKPAKP